MVIQQCKAKLHRWQQLTRYYVNKWHYDGTKWAERVWYGTGSQPDRAVASVPFMITQNMRNALTKAGFPSHEISSLLPKTAHALINDKVSYVQYLERKATAIDQQQPSASPVDTNHTEINEIVSAIEAREAAENEHSTSVSNQIVLVMKNEPSDRDHAQ